MNADHSRWRLLWQFAAPEQAVWVAMYQSHAWVPAVVAPQDDDSLIVREVCAHCGAKNNFELPPPAGLVS